MTSWPPAAAAELSARRSSIPTRTASSVALALCLSLAVGGCEKDPPVVEPAEATPTATATVQPAPPPVRPGPLCTYHGFCWQSPFPQGNSLHSVLAAAPNEVYAVGDRGTVLRYDGQGWALEDTPTRERLYGVGGVAPDSLWAVGENGTLLHRAAAEWVSVEVDTESTIRAVYGRSADDAYAVGESGLVLRFDGQAWTREALDTDLTLTQITGDETALYALGTPATSGDAEARAVVFKRSEEGWRELDEVEGDSAALALDAGVPMVAGIDARRWTGERWSRERLVEARPINGLTALDAVSFAVGYAGTVSTRRDGRWQTVTVDDDLDFHAVSGSSASDVWAVGADGAIAHFDGGRWTRVSTGSTADLRGVFARSANDVWAVGDGATLHFDGRHWREEGFQGHELRAVFGAGDLLMAAGNDGTVLRHRGAGFEVEQTGGGFELTSLFFGAPDSLVGEVDPILVGGKTRWRERHAEVWSEHDDRPSATGLYGSAPDDVYATGLSGLSHFDGSRWTPVQTPDHTVLFGVFGFGPNDIFAAGARGTLLHYDGGEWSEVEVPTEQNLISIWGAAPDDLYVVGHHGTILHYDGSEWRWRDSGTDAQLQSVFGSGPDDVYVVGHHGTILHLGGAAP